MLRLVRFIIVTLLFAGMIALTFMQVHQPAQKKLVVGFSQVGAESGWRTANTESIKSEAAARGIELKFSDAQQKQENQIKALRTFAAEHVDVIMFSPVVTTGWTPVLREIKQRGIPVIVSDRRPDVDESLYATFIGSDFLLEGHRAGDWLAKKTGGKAVIAELQGTPGSAPANDRQKGFADAIAAYPDMKVIWSQNGDFTRQGGKEAFEAFLKTPDAKQVTVLFAHNDDMALGAIQAMEEAGIKPGQDILVVSVDSIREGLQAVLAGKLNCSVECSPLLGPRLFDAAEAIVAGKTVPKRQVVDETVFDQDNVTQAVIDGRKY
jgi:simple sugar transport system substrate-binding protein